MPATSFLSKRWEFIGLLIIKAIMPKTCHPMACLGQDCTESTVRCQSKQNRNKPSAGKQPQAVGSCGSAQTVVVRLHPLALIVHSQCGIRHARQTEDTTSRQ